MNRNGFRRLLAVFVIVSDSIPYFARQGYAPQMGTQIIPNPLASIIFYAYIFGGLPCIQSTFTHTYIYIYIHSYIHTFIHSYIHTFIHSYIHTFIHSYIHTYIRTTPGCCPGVAKGIGNKFVQYNLSNAP